MWKNFPQEHIKVRVFFSVALFGQKNFKKKKNIYVSCLTCA